MSDEQPEQADTGMANERTALAWQRTALSLTVAAIVLARFTFDRLGLFAAGTLGAAAVLSAWVFLESQGRYLTHHATPRRGRARGGRAAFALALATALLAVTELSALLAS
ncbi:DUF202 domain-containing protein [Nocardioides sp. YIM 152588]|uniref:DUF202 domain-containing protein n=1 Tax=Nocardioides sp. YIM 152588 TaxID=3158259 RepID=UPI0032E4B773